MARFRLWIVAVSFVLTFSPIIQAQTNDHLIRTFDWSEDIGAPRAAAMGGAFVGLADDSTAVQLNPAGLGLLTRTEVAGSLLNRTSETLNFGDSLASRVGVGVFSAAGPIADTKLAVGVYVAQPEAERITLAPVSVAGIRDAGSFDEAVTDAGGGLAWSPTKDIHLGLRLSLMHLSLNGNLVHPVEGTRDIMDVGQASTTSNKLGGALGVLIKVTPALNVGAAYIQGVHWDAARSAVSLRTGILPTVPFEVSSPSKFSGGLSYRLTHDVTLVGEADYVLLSQLHDNLTVVILPVTASQYQLDSGVEGRAGLEWAIPSRHYAFFLRGGVDSAPTGAFKFQGATPPSEVVIFQGSGRKTAGTLGGAIGDKHGRYRFDLAAAFGGLRTDLLAGLSARF
jgi:hypothetical protein